MTIRSIIELIVLAVMIVVILDQDPAAKVPTAADRSEEGITCMELKIELKSIGIDFENAVVKTANPSMSAHWEAIRPSKTRQFKSC